MKFILSILMLAAISLGACFRREDNKDYVPVGTVKNSPAREHDAADKYLISGLQNHDSIIAGLERKYLAPNAKDRIYSAFIADVVIPKLRKSKTDMTILFPSAPFDQVSLFEYEPLTDNNYRSRKVRFVRDLTYSQAYALFDLLNNPLYYQWADCGTAIEKYLLCFYRNREQIAWVNIACNQAQFTGLPENHLLRGFGGLEIEGSNYFKSNVLGGKTQ